MPGRPSRRVGRCAVVLAAFFALTSCTPTHSPLDLDEADEKHVVVGSLGTSESEIISQLYGQVLENAGYSVTYDQTIGGRAEFTRALERGSLDIVPDYSGTLLYGLDPAAVATSAPDIAAALPLALESFDIVALTPSTTDAGEALVVTKSFSETKAVSSIGDIAPFAATINVGAPSGFDEQYVEPLEDIYGITDIGFQVIDGDGTASVGDLVADVVQLSSISMTSWLITDSGLVVLDDPEDMFTAQNVTPVVNKSALTDEVEGLLNRVSASLTTEDLAKLNARYASDDKPTAAEIATIWLKSKRLI